MTANERHISLEDELADIRSDLFAMADQVDSAESFLGVQLAIADEIVRCEAMLESDEADEYRWHIHTLRLYVDGLAWTALHPFTIIQLSKNPPAPPRLSHQLDAFRQVREAAEECAAEGVPVLICDLTHCLRMGDLVVCYDPETPQIVECKSNFKPEFIMRGRTGRQLSRAMETLRYLHTGTAKVYGEEKPRRVIEPGTEFTYTWDSLERTVSMSADGEVGVVCPSPNEIICVYPPERELELTEEVREALGGFRRCYGGFHTWAINDVCCRLASPFVWPLPSDVRFSLLECDTVVVHMIDIEHFLDVDTAGGRISKLLAREDEVDGCCFVIDVGGVESYGSAFYLDEVVYGFQTIESTAQCMVDVSRAMLEEPLPDRIPAASRGRPTMRVVRSLEEARGMAMNAERSNSGGYIMMPEDVFDEVAALARGRKKRRPSREGT